MRSHFALTILLDFCFVWIYAVRYGDELANALKKSVLIGSVAALARDIEVFKLRIEDFDLHVGEDVLLFDSLEDGETGSSNLNETRPNKSPGRARLDELLGAWEEPDAPDAPNNKHVSSGICPLSF
jgi:hypothetical protein